MKLLCIVMIVYTLCLIPVDSCGEKWFKRFRQDDNFDYSSIHAPYKIDNIVHQLMRESIINIPGLFGNVSSVADQIKDNVTKRIPNDKSFRKYLKFSKEEAVGLSFLLIDELENIEDRLIREEVALKIATFNREDEKVIIKIFYALTNSIFGNSEENSREKRVTLRRILELGHFIKNMPEDKKEESKNSLKLKLSVRPKKIAENGSRLKLSTYLEKIQPAMCPAEIELDVERFNNFMYFIIENWDDKADNFL